jgi:murein DD-endopeptidase MepM/ murein hydrolase activator NlpD
VDDDKKIKTFIQKLKEKHRLSYTDDSTYHEKWSFNLSTLNMLSLLVLYSLILVFLLFLFIRFTPVKYLFVDNASIYELKETAIKNQQIIDSLEYKINSTDNYLTDLRKILNGDSFDDTLSQNNNIPVDYNPDFSKNDADSILRYQVEHQKDNLNKKTKHNNIGFFMSPVNGKISKGFEPNKKHFGVDIVTKKDEPILAILDGVVIFSNWTSTEGNVIVIQHHNNILSMYKHCSVLLKELGDKVETADPIAIVGNSGKFTTGPHLHFEIWQDGTPLNPQELISF